MPSLSADKQIQKEIRTQCLHKITQLTKVKNLGQHKKLPRGYKIKQDYSSNVRGRKIIFDLCAERVKRKKKHREVVAYTSNPNWEAEARGWQV